MRYRVLMNVELTTASVNEAKRVLKRCLTRGAAEISAVTIIDCDPAQVEAEGKTKLKFQNWHVENLIKHAREAELEPYLKMLEHLKHHKHLIFKQVADIIELDENDVLWSIFNSAPGGSDDEINELLAKLAKVGN